VSIVAPRFGEEFRRLCQAVAIDGTGRSDQVVDGLLLVAMVYDSRPWHKAEDWGREHPRSIQFGCLGVRRNCALRRAVNDGRIENKSDTESAPADGAAKAEYVLGGEAKRITIDRIEEGDRP